MEASGLSVDDKGKMTITAVEPGYSDMLLGLFYVIKIIKIY